MFFKGFFATGLPEVSPNERGAAFRSDLPETEKKPSNRHKTLRSLATVILCGILFSTGCGVKIGEEPWSFGDRVYDWTLPSASRCDALEYSQIFEDFFTKEPAAESGLLHNMDTAVLCLKKKLTEYKKLIRGAHEDYLTRSELNNLLNHKVIRTGIEDTIDKITAPHNFSLFINVKNMVLRIFALSREEGGASPQQRGRAALSDPSSREEETSPGKTIDPPDKTAIPREGENPPQKAFPAEEILSKTVCSPPLRKEALYKTEVDKFAELLELTRHRLRDIHTTAGRLAASLNDYMSSEQLLILIESLGPERDLEENIRRLLQRNLHYLSEDLLIRYLVEKNGDRYPEEEVREAVRTFLKNGGDPQFSESFLQSWFSAQHHSRVTRDLLRGSSAEDPSRQKEIGLAEDRNPPGGGIAPLERGHALRPENPPPGSGNTLNTPTPLELSGSDRREKAGIFKQNQHETHSGDRKTDNNSPSADRKGKSLYEYLREHPKAAFSISEIREAALLFVLSNDEKIRALFPGFAGYLSGREQAAVEEKQKKDTARFYEKEWWSFGKTSAEKERDEVLDSLYAMMEISERLIPRSSRITLTDAKYLLLNIQLSEMIMDIYDFNKNDFVERRELKSAYCLFELLALSPAPTDPAETSGNFSTWWEGWKRSLSDPKNVFNYILKYQKIPLAEEINSHFVYAVSVENLADEKISLSRSAVMRLVTVLSLRFFPEKYFLDGPPPEKR